MGIHVLACTVWRVALRPALSRKSAPRQRRRFRSKQLLHVYRCGNMRTSVLLPGRVKLHSGTFGQALRVRARSSAHSGGPSRHLSGAFRRNRWGP